MKLRVFFILPFLVIGSCGLLHFYSPAVNNSVTQPRWNMMISIPGVTSPNEFSITADQDKRVFAAIAKSGSLVISLLSASGLSDNWTTNYAFSTASTANSLKVYYDKFWGVTLGYQESSSVQLKYFYTPTNAWNLFAPAFYSTGQWNYFFGMTGKLYALAQANVPNFAVIYYNTPTVMAGTWNTNQKFDVNTGMTIMDLSADIDSHDNVFVGAANFTECRIYFNGSNGNCIYNPVDNGVEYAKVAIPGDNTIYLIYKDISGPIKAQVLSYEYPGIQILKTIQIYDKAFYVYIYHDLGLSVVADKNSSKVYIGFITLDQRKPVVLKIENGTVIPLPQFPESLTNCSNIKLSINSAGLLMAGVLGPGNTLSILRQW
ncbi:MAG: hypothetical protein A2Y33_14775 [Spirochaetes bacterium GWF1_51_8]|nr:MAG: hypothetical protein A2Y33_14775 [Spirochaetes bacterium GWF1_51_8]